MCWGPCWWSWYGHVAGCDVAESAGFLVAWRGRKKQRSVEKKSGWTARFGLTRACSQRQGQGGREAREAAMMWHVTLPLLGQSQHSNLFPRTSLHYRSFNQPPLLSLISSHYWPRFSASFSGLPAVLLSHLSNTQQKISLHIRKSRSPMFVAIGGPPRWTTPGCGQQSLMIEITSRLATNKYSTISRLIYDVQRDICSIPTLHCSNFTLGILRKACWSCYWKIHQPGIEFSSMLPSTSVDLSSSLAFRKSMHHIQHCTKSSSLIEATVEAPRNRSNRIQSSHC